MSNAYPLPDPASLDLGELARWHADRAAAARLIAANWTAAAAGNNPGRYQACAALAAAEAAFHERAEVICAGANG